MREQKQNGLKVKNRFSELLYALQATQGKVTLTEIAEATGINQSYLSRVRKNPYIKLSMNSIEKLCEYFNITPGELLVISDNGNGVSNTFIPPPIKSNYNPPPILSAEAHKEAQMLLRNLDQKIETMELLIKQTQDDFAGLPVETAEVGLSRLANLRANLDAVKQVADEVRDSLEQEPPAQSKQLVSKSQKSEFPESLM